MKLCAVTDLLQTRRDGAPVRIMEAFVTGITLFMKNTENTNKMNRHLYQRRVHAEQSFLQKLLKQFPQENAVIELNNLLATNDLMSLSREDIAGIERKYRLDLVKEFKLNLEEFYAVYLHSCLADKVLSRQEIGALNHLKELLRLDNKSVDELHIRIGVAVYKRSFQEAIADGRLTSDEMRTLNELANTLRLPKELADRISSEIRTKFIENYVSRIVSDQRLSPRKNRSCRLSPIVLT